MKRNATTCAWFSIFFENAFVSLVNRRMCMRIDIHDGLGELVGMAGALLALGFLIGHACKMAGFASAFNPEPISATLPRSTRPGIAL